MNSSEQESQFEILRAQECQQYLDSLEGEWTDDNGEKYAQSDLKTLVYGNISTYHLHLRDKGLLVNKEVAALLEKLTLEGGQIVCTGQLSASQIENARIQDRLAVDINGIGYVWFPVARMEGQEG